MPDETIRVIARIVSKPDKVEDTRALLLGLVAPTLRESGCVRYEVMQNHANAAEFSTFEEWASEAAIGAHMTSAHIKEAFTKAPALLAEMPDIRQYRRFG